MRSQQLATIMKSQPSPGDVHVNKPLTNQSVRWSQSAEGFVADKVFPVIGVPNQSDIYYEYDRENWLVGGAQKRGPASESAGGGYTLSEKTYRADVWALHDDVDDHTRGNSDAPLQPDMDATDWVTENMMITKEVEWASQFFALTKWTTDLDGVSGAPGAGEFRQWSDFVNSTPIVDIRAAQFLVHGLTGKKPNTLVLGAEVWAVLQDNPDFIERINGSTNNSDPAIFNLRLLAQILSLSNVYVAEGVRNTAQEGATETTSFIMGKAALLMYVEPTPGIKKASAGYTYSWTGMVGAGSTGTRIKSIRDEFKEMTRIEGQEAYVHKQVSADLGVFFDTAIA